MASSVGNRDEDGSEGKPRRQTQSDPMTVNITTELLEEIRPGNGQLRIHHYLLYALNLFVGTRAANIASSSSKLLPAVSGMQK